MAFSVARTSRSFIRPAEPTPSHILSLSTLDRVPGLCHMVRSLHVFKQGSDATRVIKQALAKVLVLYYPFAGRFVDSEHGELCLSCTGEGVWFLEATAECRLEDVKYLEYPLMISQEELLPEPSPETDPLNLPVMMQVTEFTCGGFVMGLISVHAIADGLGAGQFINAIADLARGLDRPTVDPVWARDIIPNPPKLPTGPPPRVLPSVILQHHNTDFSLTKIAEIKAEYFDSTAHRCSTFDVSIAKAWQARTRAINLNEDEPVHVCFFASTRHLLGHHVSVGYYGNCFYPVTATATSGRISAAELVDVVKIIRDAKAKLPLDFARWAVGDFEDDPYELDFSYTSMFVSDWTRLGFLEADYGWGKPVHVVPFAYCDYMAVAIIGAPPAPKKSVRIMTQCVEKEHLLAFQEEMKAFS